MSRVALVFPYFRTKAPTEMLFPPLGAAVLSGQFKKLGVEVHIFDNTFGSLEMLRAGLDSYRPQIVGIYSMVSLSRNTFRIAEMVRERFPHCLLAAGGPMPTLYPGRYAQQFDIVLRGEVDLSFPQFCRDYFDQKITRENLAQMAPGNYDGLFIDKPGLQVDNPTIHYSEDIIQSFPLPDRGDFDHAAYQGAWQAKNGSKTTSLITTYGCPFSCDFCSKPVFGEFFRRRDLDQVFEEVSQIRGLGYDRLWIADDTLTLNFSYLESFCRRMSQEGIGWSCLSRSTGITEEIALLMKEANCQRVYLGLETASQATLNLMNKKATLDDGLNAVHQFKKAGVEVAAFFIVGYPGESPASIEDTFKYALTLPLDDISFNVPYPLPGSQLFERVSGLDEARDWNKENEVTFIYESEFDQDWLRLRIGQTMQAFSEKSP